jgi:hypothetical protein
MVHVMGASIPQNKQRQIITSLDELQKVSGRSGGMPLNGDLKQLGGTFSPCRADHTELLALRTCGTVRAQARPATGRDREGAAIELGVWALAPQQFGTFVAAIPPPPSGSVRSSVPMKRHPRASWPNQLASKGPPLSRPWAAGGHMPGASPGEDGFTAPNGIVLH